MTDVLDEATADQEVIKSLIKYIRKLEGIMGKLLFDETGALFLAHSFEKVSVDDLQSQIKSNQEDINKVNNIINLSQKLSVDNTIPTQSIITEQASPITDQVQVEQTAPETASEVVSEDTSVQPQVQLQ